MYLRSMTYDDLARIFPWVQHLPREAAAEFAADLEAALGKANLLADLDPVIAAWKATAEIYADPELRAALIKPTDGDYGPVTAPAA
jgi:hypothetical protein